MHHSYFGLVLLTVSVLVCVQTAAAQSFGRVEQTETNVDSYFYHVRPGAATVQVEVLGAVRSPGLYEIADGTHLRQLLALAGGPILSVRERTRRRETHLILYRPSEEGNQPQQMRLDAVLSGESASPLLVDGDVLTVDVVERRRVGWRDVVTIIGGAASLALAIERFSRVN